jgi:phage terminase large subunit-like protein
VSSYPAEVVVAQYVQDVLGGRIPACHWLQAACRRHLRDLETGAERGLWFDPDAAQLVISFFSLLKHSKGEWAGQVIRLEPWQVFVLWVLFGWKRADGTRRFRTCYLEMGRKNGKSTMAAGVGLYLLVADGEPGAEVYSAATKRAQAQITHSEASRMVKASPALRRRLTVFRDNIHIAETASKFEPLGADSDTMDGLNMHGGIIDEVHAHKTREVWDLLDTATSSRRQPLIFAITTAGFSRESLCWQLHEYTQKILDRIIEDDTFFGIVFSIDDGDDWEDESCWAKANPNLGVSKKLDDMQRWAARAKEMPSALNAFLRLHLTIWTQADTRWVPVGHWEACGMLVDANGLRGRTGYGGLDLSSNTDITALLLVFPPDAPDETYRALCRFWIPEDNMVERSHRDRVPYEAWVRQGFIETTPGNVIDYDFILAAIDELMQAYDLKEIAFDRWGATKIQTQLMDRGGDKFLVQFGQGYVSMSPPMKMLETLILGHKLAHGNNPVLTWMAHNLVASQDAAGNIKPDKEHSLERIDGMVALIMALDRAIRHEAAGSVYDTRGILEL